MMCRIHLVDQNCVILVEEYMCDICSSTNVWHKLRNICYIGWRTNVWHKLRNKYVILVEEQMCNIGWGTCVVLVDQWMCDIIWGMNVWYWFNTCVNKCLISDELYVWHYLRNKYVILVDEHMICILIQVV